MAKPLKRCNHPTCRQLIPFDTQYCSKHTHMKREKHKAYDEYRQREETKYRNVYNSARWRNLRKQIMLRDDYVCQNCLSNDQYTPAEVVHHIIEVKDNIDKAYDADNLVSWCNACHNKHHKAEI